MVQKHMFCGVAVSCGPQNATVKKSLARNVFVAKQRQSYCQNISHDTLRVVFVVENQRGADRQDRRGQVRQPDVVRGDRADGEEHDEEEHDAVPQTSFDAFV